MGFDNSQAQLNYGGAGSAIIVDNCAFALKDIRIESSGSVIDATLDDGNFYGLRLWNITGTAEASNTYEGETNNTCIVSLSYYGVDHGDNDCHTFTDGFKALFFRSSYIGEKSSEALLNIEAAEFEYVHLSGLVGDLPGDTTYFIKGTGSVINQKALVAGCSFSSDTVLDGITVNDDKWFFTGNYPFACTQTKALVYFNDNATPVSVSTSGTSYNLAGTWSDEVLHGFTLDSSTGALTYTGDNDVVVDITATGSALNSSGGTVELSFGFRSGAIDQSTDDIDGSFMPVSVESGDSVTFHSIWEVTLSTGDEVQVRGMNVDDTDDFTVTDVIFRVS